MKTIIMIEKINQKNKSKKKEHTFVSYNFIKYSLRVQYIEHSHECPVIINNIRLKYNTILC